MTLADGLMQYNIALQCNSGCSAVQGKAMPEKKERKSEMRRMQDDHSYLALYRDTAVVYAPRRSPIPVEKVRTEARE